MPSGAARFRSCSAMVVVTTASRMPSGISWPSPHSTAGLVIRWPTLRTNSSERPCSATSSPRGAGVLAVGVQAAGEGLAALGHLLGQRALQDAEPVAVGLHLVLRRRPPRPNPPGPGWSTAPTSSTRSLTPAGSSRPIGCARSMRMSRCSPWCASSTADGASASPWKPTNCAGFFRPTVAPSFSVTARLPSIDAVGRGIEVRALLQRRAAVEHMARVFDDLGAAHRVVAAALVGAAVLGDARRCRTARRTASPSARWPRSAHSARW